MVHASARNIFIERRVLRGAIINSMVPLETLGAQGFPTLGERREGRARPFSRFCLRTVSVACFMATVLEVQGYLAREKKPPPPGPPYDPRCSPTVGS